MEAIAPRHTGPDAPAKTSLTTSRAKSAGALLLETSFPTPRN
ncbi:hypothetical protein EYZ11_007157 [Aspergillus tanneri]|uniref:Uncharacterized protein n=1 Tax=Aspergillus tanneri TaxID=1220188 RepID=A0A4S3JE62_9EURO|nr:hypothetical protein EYZ11_007157 [Aspergillus tanneri]